MTTLNLSLLTTLCKSAFVTVMMMFLISCFHDIDTAVIGSVTKELSYEEAVKQALAKYKPSKGDEPRIISYIFWQLETLTLIPLTYDEKQELRLWLETKTLDELHNIAVHLKVAEGGEYNQFGITYTHAGFSPDQYVVPDGQTPVQFLQLLMTTSL